MMSITQLASTVNSSRQFILLMINEGRLQAERDRLGHYIIPQSEVDRMIDEFHVKENIKDFDAATKEIGVSRTTLYKLIKENKVNAYMLPNKKYGITQEEINRVKKILKKSMKPDFSVL